MNKEQPDLMNVFLFLFGVNCVARHDVIDLVILVVLGERDPGQLDLEFLFYQSAAFVQGKGQPFSESLGIHYELHLLLREFFRPGRSQGVFDCPFVF